MMDILVEFHNLEEIVFEVLEFLSITFNDLLL